MKMISAYKIWILFVSSWSLVIFFGIIFVFFPVSNSYAKTYLQVGLLHEPRNLNPFGATDSWSKKVLGLIYQPLYRLDPETSKPIPWLAEGQPIHAPEKNTVTIHLRNASWDDGTEFSAQDVVFTAQVFKKFKISKFYSYWKSVKKIEAVDKRTVRITIENPKAVFFTQALSSFIVQKKKWEPIIRNAEQKMDAIAHGETTVTEIMNVGQRTIQNHKISRPTGLGPYKFEARKRGVYLFLVSNDLFFGQGRTIQGQVLGPYVQQIIFKIFNTLGDATIALKRGEIDLLWKGVSHAFVEDLSQDASINIPMVLDSGFRYLAFNLRKSPMSDPAFRKAVAFLIDKDYITRRIIHGHGQRLDSVIPPNNTFYFNPDTPVYGTGLQRKERIAEAYRIMRAAGYRWKIPPVSDDGRPQTGKGLMLPNGNLMPPLTLLSHSAEYDTEAAATTRTIQQWLQAFGMPVASKALAFRGLMNKIRQEREYDMFVMGWRNLSLDPDYLRRFFHSDYDRPDSRNDTGYQSPPFDRDAEWQADVLNLDMRRKIVFRLQNRLMKDIPYIPLYVPHRMEGVRTDRFKGWKINERGVGNIWTFTTLRPTIWWEKSHRLHN